MLHLAILHAQFCMLNSEDGVVQLPTQPAENRCAQQEGMDLGRLLIKHLFEHVAGDQALRAGDGADGGG